MKKVDIEVLRYFWKTKDDIECAEFDRDALQQQHPELLKAWDDYRTARSVFSAVLRGIDS